MHSVRLWELKTDYDPVDIWNMTETGCFFKVLPKERFAEKKSWTRGGKKPKMRPAIVFPVSAYCHPENLFVLYSNVKVIFYLKTLRQGRNI